jgi:replicative DNA helicase
VNADDAERAVLGAILSGWRDVDSLHLRPEDFYQPRHEAVFDAIQRAQRAGSRPDMVTVRVALGQHPSMRAVNPEIFLAELAEACPVTIQAPRYAAEVIDAADRRGHDNLADRIKAMVADGLPPQDITDRIRGMLDKAPRRGATAGQAWSEIDPAIIDHIEHGARRGIPTPWPDMNRHLTGLVGSRLYVVAARPGHGKSLLGQSLATHTCLTQRRNVLFASLEMSELDLGVRIYADQANVSLGTLLAGSASTSQWDAIREASNQLRGMGCRVNANPAQTVADIRADARGIRDLGLIVVDYLQLVTPASGSRRQDRREQVDQIARDLKLLAKELDVPVVALAQLNRNNQQRADREPQLSDLRESGAIEQDADVVILLDLIEETGELDAYVKKNRHGTKGKVSLELWGHYARIVQGQQKSA